MFAGLQAKLMALGAVVVAFAVMFFKNQALKLKIAKDAAEAAKAQRKAAEDANEAMLSVDTIKEVHDALEKTKSSRSGFE